MKDEDIEKIIQEIRIKNEKMEEQYNSSHSTFLEGYTEALRYCLNKFKRY